MYALLIHVNVGRKTWNDMIFPKCVQSKLKLFYWKLFFIADAISRGWLFLKFLQVKEYILTRGINFACLFFSMLSGWWLKNQVQTFLCNRLVLYPQPYSDNILKASCLYIPLFLYILMLTFSASWVNVLLASVIYIIVFALLTCYWVC